MNIHGLIMNKILIIISLISIAFVSAFAGPYTSLHDFGSVANDGAKPNLVIPLIVGNTIFGVTTNGGSSDDGVLFKVQIDGSGYTILKNFNGTSDGGTPDGGLVIIDSVLFGTTINGGSGYGVLYSIDTTGNNFHVLHNFSWSSDPCFTYEGLTVFGTKLFGVGYNNQTSPGGIYYYDLSDNSFHTIKFFTGTDGGKPISKLLLINNTLFGMTSDGGSHIYGVVFKIDSAGSNYSVIYNFTGTDANHADNNLIFVNNRLYGLSYNGGISNLGSIFRLDTNGSNFELLHSFGISGDIIYPYMGLTYYQGKLFGTASAGGSNNNGGIFSIDTNGANYNLLYRLDNSGIGSYSNLTLKDSLLYGTRFRGGTYNKGQLFSFDPFHATVTTSSTTNILGHSALASGNITYMSSDSVTTRGFCWNTSGSPTTSDNVVSESGHFGTGNYSLVINGLAYNATYHIRSFTINPAGTSYGADSVFTTMTSTLATITTSAVSGIGVNSATGNGNIISIGSDSVTVRGFCWNTTGTPTIADSVVSESGTYSTGAYSLSMTGMTMETFYHVRAYATNAAGTAYGNEVTFSTIPMPAWALGLMTLGLVVIGVFLLYRKMII